MNAAKLAVLTEHCRELKLPRVVREYEGLVRQASDAEWEYGDFLIHLLELEVLGRRDATANRRIREAHFPEVKTLDQFDWTALKGVPKPKSVELATCEFLGKGEDIVIAGPIGTGKTMLATAIGVHGQHADATVEVLVYQNPFYHWWRPQREFAWYYEDIDPRYYGYNQGGGQVIKRETAWLAVGNYALAIALASFELVYLPISLAGAPTERVADSLPERPQLVASSHCIGVGVSVDDQLGAVDPEPQEHEPVIAP